MMKMTKKEMFSVIAGILEGKVVVADMIQEDKDFLLSKIAHEVELLDKKAQSGGSKNPSKAQKENAEIKVKLLAHLEASEKPLRVCEIIAHEDFPYSSSKITRLLSDMAKDDTCPVMRTEVKKIAYYGV